MSQIEERLAQTQRDLAELDEQVAQGELDEATAEMLRQRYEEERRRLEQGLEADEPDEAKTRAFSGRQIAGAGFVLVSVIAMALFLISRTDDAPAGIEGLATDSGVNLDDVSNEEMEAVVAQNPDIPGMRLALADRYFVEGDFSNALTHYMYVLDALEIKDPSALANVGWMTYVSGEAGIAESFVEESLRIQPDGGIAFWYLANIRARGLGDTAGAMEPLQQLLEYENLPEEIRTEAELLLEQVEAAQ